mmetsp:Transcript_13103/g.35287  ORF Transcript_13103/g.35287 Transcript_13103/m.35287 type:complete len:465 (+) Transcript_13103:1235-2629(+)
MTSSLPGFESSRSNKPQSIATLTTRCIPTRSQTLLMSGFIGSNTRNRPEHLPQACPLRAIYLKHQRSGTSAQSGCPGLVVGRVVVTAMFVTIAGAPTRVRSRPSIVCAWRACRAQLGLRTVLRHAKQTLDDASERFEFDPREDDKEPRDDGANSIPSRDAILESIRSGEIVVPETSEDMFSQYEMLELGRDETKIDTRPTEQILFQVESEAPSTSPARERSREQTSLWMRHYTIELSEAADLLAFVDALKEIACVQPPDSNVGTGAVESVVLRRVTDTLHGLTRGEKPPSQVLVLMSFKSEKALTTKDTVVTAAVESTNARETGGARLLARTDYRVLTDARLSLDDSELHADQFGLAADRVEPQFVGTQMLTANWTSTRFVTQMDDAVREFAERMVRDGVMSCCMALQSTREPSFFKTLEVYKSYSAMEVYMNNVDKEFNESILPFRAAVNRVRQVFAPASQQP